MANPLRLVATMKARKLSCVREELASGPTDAENKAALWRASGDYKRVVPSSYKYGSRSEPKRQWRVRAYA